MKKVLIILLVLMSSSLVFADVLSQSAVIAAIKRRNNNGTIPSVEAQIRLVETNAAEFGEGSTVQIPIAARSASYTAFNWTYSGNLYQGVTISFTFKPMKKLNESQSLNGNLVYDSSTVIPYTVDFSYTSTRVGNSIVNINKSPPTNLRTELAYWGGAEDAKKYYIAYADTIKLMKGNTNQTGLRTSAAITRTEATISVSANMYTKSVIYYSAATGSSTVPKDEFIKAFTVNGESHTPVCEHWVRSGSVAVTLNIDATGSNWTVNDTNGQKPKVVDGVYYADVVVSFTKE